MTYSNMSDIKAMVPVERWKLRFERKTELIILKIRSMGSILESLEQGK